MSLILQSSGGGQITVQEPTTASNFTQTLPAATGNVILDSTAGVCRAWVNFNGTGTVAIRSSFNVSSITDNGTGDYTVNFTTAMPNANYSFAGAGGTPGNTFSIISYRSTAPTTAACRIGTYTTAQSLQDDSFVSLQFFSS